MSRGNLLDPDTCSVYAVLSDPPVNPARVVPNLEPSPLDWHHQVQILKAIDLAQDNSRPSENKVLVERAYV